MNACACFRYVQGMNEILAPVYFVFAKDSDQAFAKHAEADAFFVFTIIMSDLRDRFIKSLDDSSRWACGHAEAIARARAEILFEWIQSSLTSAKSGLRQHH